MIVLWSMLTVSLLAAGIADATMATQAQRVRAAGIDVVTYRTGVKDVVVLIGVLPAGDAMAGGGNIAVPTLVGMMLDRGTKTLDKYAIADQLESVGAEVAFGVGIQSLEIRAKCLRKDLPMVMGLIGAELRTPALQPAEFAKAKQQFIGSLQASLQNTEGRAQEAFGRSIYPDSHPNHPHSVAEYIAAAKVATVDELKAFHARYYGPAHMTLVLAGDVSADSVQTEVTKAFAGWTGGENYRIPQHPAGPSGPRETSVPLADKPSVSIVIGQATGLQYRDPDALALRMGTAILGHGFTGRLMGAVRDREGLTYNIGAAVSQDTIADGAWEVSASFAPALLDQGIAATRREVQHWWSEGITETELADHKQGLVGGYRVGLATTAGLASTIVTTLQRGYDLTWLDDYPKALRALTRAQVNTAIKAHLDPAAMVLVEAGSIAAQGRR
ncbi:MAG: insulinase family protein [Pseudomonadota bacterium]|nr:insulinase family protein [Pseudomonadota bacterium]